jgi:hypothetical protein
VAGFVSNIRASAHFKEAAMHRPPFASLAIVTALACHNDPAAPGAAAAGLTLALALTRTELPHGEPDTITVTLTNTTNYPVTVTGDACQPRPYVTNERRVAVSPSGIDWVCVALLVRYELAPLERRISSYVWQTGSLAPGVYAISATFTADQVSLATPPAAVRVN